MHDVSVLAHRAHAILFEGASPKNGVSVRKTSGGLKFLTAQGFKFLEQNARKEYSRPGKINWARMAREGHTVLQVVADKDGPFQYIGVCVGLDDQPGTYHSYSDTDQVSEFESYRD